MLGLQNGFLRLYGRSRYALRHVALAEIGLQYRTYSTPPIAKNARAEVKVGVRTGLKEQLHLLISPPPIPEPNAPIIIFLRRGVQTASHASFLDELALSANATIVRLEYGLSQDERFPFPVHNVLAGWDWICQNLTTPIFTGGTAMDESKPSSKIGVCGELIGGSLAAMLALTECHDEGKDPTGLERNRVSAAVIGNPLVDWTALFPRGEDFIPVDCLLSQQHTLEPEAGSQQEGADPSIHHSLDLGHPNSQMGNKDEDFLSIQTLLDIRQIYFRKPEHFFDPFASPMLFFRTPSFDLPYEQAFNSSRSVLSDEASVEDEAATAVVKKRVYNRTYPPKNAKLLLPSMKITVGEDCVLRQQGMEFVDRLKASARRGGAPNLNGSESNATTRFDLEREAGLGLWGKKDVVNIGAWFGEVLRTP